MARFPKAGCLSPWGPRAHSFGFGDGVVFGDSVAKAVVLVPLELTGVGSQDQTVVGRFKGGVDGAIVYGFDSGRLVLLVGQTFPVSPGLLEGFKMMDVSQNLTAGSHNTLASGGGERDASGFTNEIAGPVLPFPGVTGIDGDKDKAIAKKIYRLSGPKRRRTARGASCSADTDRRAPCAAPYENWFPFSRAPFDRLVELDHPRQFPEE